MPRARGQRKALRRPGLTGPSGGTERADLAGLTVSADAAAAAVTRPLGRSSPRPASRRIRWRSSSIDADAIACHT